MQELQRLTIPWHKPAENVSQKDTIETKYGKLIQRYKDMVAQKQAERLAAAKTNQEKNAENEDKNATEQG